MRVSRIELYAGRALLIALIALVILPFVSIFTTALHPSGAVPSGLRGRPIPQWGNFIEAFNVANMRALLTSSVFIVVAVVPVSLLLSTMAGFGIGLLRIPGARWLLLLFIFGLTLPFEGIITPLYFLAREMGILNTRLAIVLPLIGLFMPFAVFWMRAHFVNMPNEISEAARVDGASYVGPVLADPRAAGARADRVARHPHVGLGVESVPARAGPRRGSNAAHDGRRARGLPGPLRNGHSAAFGWNDADPAADPPPLHPLSAAGDLGVAAGVGQGMRTSAATDTIELDDGRLIHGFVDDGYGAVMDTFLANFRDRHELGASCAVYRGGVTVVELWGGIADARTARRWERDTSAVIFSCSKALVAICAYVLVQERRLDLDVPVARYWPEFGTAGKSAITLRDAMSHRAGLPVLDRDLSTDNVLAWGPVIQAIEAQTPLHAPEAGHFYHAMTYGWLVGEIVRRLTGQTPGQWFHAQVAVPLGLRTWIGLPAEAIGRVAWMEAPLADDESDAARESARISAENPVIERSLTMGGAYAFPADGRFRHVQ